MRVYLDHNATSVLRPSVKAAMVAALDVTGNPSSVHFEGRAAYKLIDDARLSLGYALDCLPQMITFTSGGTEANTMAIRGVDAQRILVSAVEHPSVLAAARASGKAVEVIPVDGEGVVDLGALEKMITGPNTLVSVMAANNETGVVQPLEMIAAMARGAGALLHVDAVQAFKKMPINFGLLGCDMMTVAAHKIGGPIGVGALVIRDGLVVEPLLCGGGQELRRRAGTENVAAIAGFGALAKEPELDVRGLRDQVETELTDSVVFGAGVTRLGNTTCFAHSGLRAETVLMQFDLDGVAVSSGSACSSGKVGRSHVLDAMGVAADISTGAIRVSLGWNTSADDVRHFSKAWKKILARASARRAA